MKLGRNDPCFCGSGKKYKKCCINTMIKQKVKPRVPEFLTCNECGGQAPKDSYQYMDTKGMEGINMAIAGICQNCNTMTYGVSGEPEAVQKVMNLLSEDMDSNLFGIDKA